MKTSTELTENAPKALVVKTAEVLCKSEYMVKFHR